MRQQRQARPQRSQEQSYRFESGSSRADYERHKREVEARRREREANTIHIEVRAHGPQDQEVPVLLFGTHVLYNDEHLADNPLRGAGVSIKTLKIRDGEVRGRSGSSSTYGHKATRQSMLRTQPKAALYILSRDRRLAALAEITPKEAEQPVEVLMRPACRVTGIITSSALIRKGRLLPHAEVDVHWQDHQPLTYRMPIKAVRPSEPPKPGVERYRFTCYLPPGGPYVLEMQAGGDIASKRMPVTVNPGQTHIDLGLIDLPLAPMVALEGAAAPEFDPAPTWIRGKPVTLSELKGKPIVIYFTNGLNLVKGGGRVGAQGSSPRRSSVSRRGVSGGSFGGGGAAGGVMTISHTELQRIVDDFKRDRVELIVFCKRYDRAKQLLGALRFRVAHCPFDTGEPNVMSQYHVSSFPSTIIVDKQGRVAAALSRAPTVEDIEQALNTRAVWRNEFERLYSLRADQAVKLIRQPFRSVRQKYWFSHPYGIMASGLADKAVYAWRNGRVVRESDWWGSEDVISQVLDGIPLREDRPSDWLLRSHMKGGDWVYRPDAPLADRIRDLNQLLPRHLGTPATVTTAPVNKGEIRVSGRYHYKPLEGREDDGVVHAFIGPGMPAGQSKARSDWIDQFFLDLSCYMDQTLLFEHVKGELPQMRYCIHSDLDQIKASTGKTQADLLSRLFTTIAQQTGLKFDYDPEPQKQLIVSAPVWETQFGPPELWGRD